MLCVRMTNSTISVARSKLNTKLLIRIYFVRGGLGGFNAFLKEYVYLSEGAVFCLVQAEKPPQCS